MSLAANRARLAADLGAIAGVKRVYDTLAEVMPSNPDLPCFELDVRQPFLTVTGGAIGTTDRTQHFDLLFLYAPEALGKPIENITAIEEYAEATITKLYANFTGAGLYLINKDTGTLDFSGYLIVKDNAPAETRYWGFQATLDVTEMVTTTMGSGS